MMMRVNYSLFLALITILCFIGVTKNAYASYYITFINDTDQPKYFHGELGNCDNKPDDEEYDAYTGKIEPYQSKKIFRMDYGYGMFTKGDEYCFNTYITDKESDLYKQPRLKLSWRIRSDGPLTSHFLESSYGLREGNNYSRDYFFTGDPNPEDNDHGVAFYAKDNVDYGDGKYKIYAAAISDLSDLQGVSEIYYTLTDEDAHKRFNSWNSDTTLTLLSYNVKIWPFYAEVIPDGVYDNQRDRRVELIADQIVDYDVVALQELFDRNSREKIIRLLQSEYPYSYDAATMNGIPLSSGVLILSKWPIMRKSEHIFSNSSGADSLSSKAISYVLINKKGRAHHILATHTQAGDDEESIRVRGKQFDEIKDFINYLEIPEQESAILLGDLNIDNNSFEYESTIGEIYDGSMEWLNSNVLPYSYNPMINTMITNHSEKAQFLDYIIPLKGHKDPTRKDSRMRVIRGADDGVMYTGGRSIISSDPFGMIDLSDHFAFESHFTFD